MPHSVSAQVVFRSLVPCGMDGKYRHSQHVIFGQLPDVIRFSLAICPRACFLYHVMLSVQEYGRLPSADRGTSLRGITAGRGRKELGKKNQSLNVSYDWCNAFSS